MKKISIQILVDDQEYKALKEQADKLGLTVPLYIKSRVVKGDDFGTYYKELIKRVEKLPSGTRFNIRALFGVDWTMSKGVKLNLGKTYYSRVSEGVIKNVKMLEKDSSNVMWYEKI